MRTHQPTPTTWDSNVYERLFTESPAEQLYNSTPARVLQVATREDSFLEAVAELAAEYETTPALILASVRRTLNWYAALE